jgi:hypothetical protein
MKILSRGNVLSRRNVLTCSATVAGGLAGAGVIGTRLAAIPATQPSPLATPAVHSPVRLSLTARDLRGLGQQRGPHNYKPGDQIVSEATLVEPDGGEAGSFHSTAVVVRSQGHQEDAATLEQHNFELRDGTLVGSGLAGRLGEPAEFAVVGGTGRYRATRGSYTAVQWPYHQGGDGTASFVFDVFDQE